MGPFAFTKTVPERLVILHAAAVDSQCHGYVECIATAEPAYLTKYAFQLAQQFNNFYHRHHVLNETDAGRKALLLATAAVAKREMTRALGYLGIPAPVVM